MDVAISELRANLKDWVARAAEGDEVVVTDRGIPVARLIGVEATALLARLVDEGAIARPRVPSRPVARGRTRPRPRRPVSEHVSEQRR